MPLNELLSPFLHVQSFSEIWALTGHPVYIQFTHNLNKFPFTSRHLRFIYHIVLEYASDEM